MDSYPRQMRIYLDIMPIVHAQVQVWREQKKKTVVSWLWFGCLRTTNKRGRRRMIIMMTIMDVESMMCLMDPVLPFFFFFGSANAVLQNCAQTIDPFLSVVFMLSQRQTRPWSVSTGQLFILGRDRREP